MKDLDACPAYFLWSLNVKVVNVVKYKTLESYVEKYKFQSMTIKYTNPVIWLGCLLAKRPCL